MSTDIYILKLKQKKYYVGKTQDINKRFQEHLNGYGSAWTNLFKPIKIEKVIKNCSSFDEDKYVKEYMCIYGVDNVRGGSYVSIDLDPLQKLSIQREIWGATDKCTRCGRKGHFINSCYAKTDVDGDFFESESESEESEENTCYRCGRTGHWANNCYAKTHI